MKKTISQQKVIRGRAEKTCSVCGKKIKVILYRDRSYRGGHYFFDVPICTKAEEKKAFRAGTREWKFRGQTFHVLKRDPKPYKFLEYWECPQCYWRPTKHERITKASVAHRGGMSYK